MQQPYRRPVLTLLLLAASLVVIGASVGGFLALVSAPRPHHLDVGKPGDSRFLAGFYRTEYADNVVFRWSSPDARIKLYGLRPGAAVLSLRLHYHGRETDTNTNTDTQTGDCGESGNQQRLQVHRAERTIAAFDVRPGWRVYRLYLPAEATAGTGFAAATLHLVAGEFHPDAHDGRDLGIPVDRVDVFPLEASHLVWSVLLQRVLLLLWGLAVLAGLLWLLNRVLSPEQSRGAALLHTGIQTAGAALLLVLWLWRDPFVLAWAWSAAPWGLVGASGGILVLAGMVHQKVHQKKILTRLFPFSLRPSRPSHSLRFKRPIRLTIGIPLLLVVLAHVLLVLPLPVAWRGSAAWGILAVPGVLLVLLLLRYRERDPLALVLLAGSGGLVVAPLLLLLIQAWPGPVPWWSLLLACDVVSAVLVWRLLYDSASNSEPQTPKPEPCTPPKSFCYRPLWPMLLVLLVGAAFRLPSLGNAEFQGDEAHIVLMAAGVTFGEDDMLMLHRKGPLEILLAAGPLVLTGHINEWIARLPFALAGIANLLGCYLLARRMFRSSAAGLLAAGILAYEGFFIGFSRIVQYQSVVILMTIAGIWCCWRFAEEREGGGRYLVLAALFAAAGLLAHYDAIFGLPAMAWLVVVGGMRRGWRGGQWVRHLLLPVAVGGTILALFYLPFVLHEHFAKTFAYILKMRIGERSDATVFHNNLPGYFWLATFYNTTYEVRTAGVMLTAGILVWLRVWGRPRLLGWGLAVLLLAGCGFLVWGPEHLAVANRVNLTIVAFALPLAGLLLSPATPHPLRTALLWFAFPFVAESFIIAKPNTHFYTMLPAAALLMGVALVQVWQWARRKHFLWVLSPFVLWSVVLVLLAVPYIYLLFLQQSPEYERRFPAFRPDLYLANYGDEKPWGSRFGFPHRDGWKVVGELYREGVIQGPYASNQKPLVTTWYLRGIPYVSREDQPANFFGVRGRSHFLPPQGYHLFGKVVIDGVRMMDLYRREPVHQPPRVYHLRDYRDRFDAQRVRPFATPRELFILEPP
jgi:4-amino-4-deoxy-L-arabinose transferase-like glycosyltransferase